MRKLIWTAVLALGLTSLWAQERDTAYVRVISQRTDGNMKNLGLTDPETYERVKEVIMNHYFTLNDIYDERDSLKAAGTASGEIKTVVDAKLYRHHFAFLSGLMADLNAEQVEQVKNALTYNVLNVTYTAHLDMIPSLTEAEKRQIYAWLYEARELALDAGSSREKHEVFGKYKGRINNYLSKVGYDLVKEREGWYERIRQRGGEVK